MAHDKSVYGGVQRRSQYRRYGTWAYWEVAATIRWMPAIDVKMKTGSCGSQVELFLRQ
jgi:hypothetical protein